MKSKQVLAAVAICASVASANSVQADGSLAVAPANGVVGEFRTALGGFDTTLNAVNSARSGGLVGGLRSFAGDTYNAALLGQTTTQAAFLTAAGRVTTFTAPNLAGSFHGTMVGRATATARIFSADVGFIAPGIYRTVVGVFTSDGLDIGVSGLNIGGNPVTQTRFDVGTGTIGGNALTWDNLPGPITGSSIFSVVLADGAALATSSALTDLDADPLDFASNVVWNGVVGSVVDEIWMVYDFNVVPTPGTAAIVGLAGLCAAKRRRA